MNILIRQARIFSERSDFNGKTMDLLIEGGTLTEIKKSISPESGTKVIEEEGLCVSDGWIDLQVVACDPGFEHKENLESVIKAAASGGFTGICLHSNTQPPLDSKAQIEYILGKTQNKVVDVWPLGTITQGGKGKDISEMYDMQKAGAPGFSDYKQPLRDAGLLLRALQYSSGIQSFIIAHCQDESLIAGGQMNEGEQSTALGLKGMPALAEELMLQRNLSVLEYSGGRLHIPTISSKGSVDLIRKAKSSGLNVSCGVAAVNLLLDDSYLKDFESNFKVNPPLRTKKDIAALRSAVESGLIDVIVSDHNPQDSESKELEFDLAEFGMIGLQTTFSCAFEGLKEKNLESIIRCFTSGPRSVLRLPEQIVQVGSAANLTLFNPKGETVLTEKNNASRSVNSPFLNKSLAGRVVGVINGSKSFFN
ncbi:MAG TPA: dihydroorotase [Bacteroidia bacterium]|nr:dihydroorotase [Bacteroidia bacterium]